MHTVEKMPIQTEPFSNSLIRGPQKVLLRGLKITLPLESLVLSSSIIVDLNDHFYTAMFFGNKTVKSMMVFASQDKCRFELVQEISGVVDSRIGKEVRDILGPFFPKDNKSLKYFSTVSQRPAYIAVVLENEGYWFLFSFKIFRGALRSPSLLNELCNSILVA